MKHKFVLDVNTVIFAQNDSDAEGRQDFASATLIYLIAQNCHRIVCNISLKRKYLENLKDIRLARLMKYLMYNEEKCEDRNFLPEYPFEKDLPEDDVEIVKLAVLAQALFVTSDHRLVTKIRDLKLGDNFGLRVVDPLAAQVQAAEKSK